jgi:hypothetical protein
MMDRIEKIEVNLKGEFAYINHGSQKLKNSLIYSLFASKLWKENIENEVLRIKDDIHALDGIVKLIEEVDRSIGIIRRSLNEEESVKNLSNEFGVDEKQAQAFVEISFDNINIDYQKVKLYLHNCIEFFEKFTSERQ